MLLLPPWNFARKEGFFSDLERQVISAIIFNILGVYHSPLFF